MPLLSSGWLIRLPSGGNDKQANDKGGDAAYGGNNPADSARIGGTFPRWIHLTGTNRLQVGISHHPGHGPQNRATDKQAENSQGQNGAAAVGQQIATNKAIPVIIRIIFIRGPVRSGFLDRQGRKGIGGGAGHHEGRAALRTLNFFAREFRGHKHFALATWAFAYFAHRCWLSQGAFDLAKGW